MSSRDKKKQRRAERKRKCIEKEDSHKIEAWNSGKLLEENHDGINYSPEYTKAIATRLYEKLNPYQCSNQDEMIKKLWKYKEKIITLLVEWNDEVSRSLPQYVYLKALIEAYWDNKDLSSVISLYKLDAPKFYYSFKARK